MDQYTSLWYTNQSTSIHQQIDIHGNLRTVSNGEDTASLLQVGSGGGAQDPLLKDGGDLAQGSLGGNYLKLHIVEKDSIIVNSLKFT